MKKQNKKWSMNCLSVVSASTSFLKNKQITSAEMNLPTFEHQVKVMLDSMPEDDTTELKKEMDTEDALQLSEDRGHKQETDLDIDYGDIYMRAEFLEEDCELSWFNAGVRVGVWIGLGICLGIGISVGLLVCTYQATTRNFKRRLIRCWDENFHSCSSYQNHNHLSLFRTLV
ncbi:uncharacterized protein At1g01500-like isoform X3 [Musa acuminata AAA Group]|uniref:uncharacterized protein At1g01500-like isoform X3 n=1 Tax=Musa acuminata AAA Group TaxID=214697 RepID=UPI0031D1593F